MLYEAFISESSKARLARKGLVVGKRALAKFKRGKGRHLVKKVTKGKGGSIVKSTGGAIVPSGKGGAIVPYKKGGAIVPKKGGAIVPSRGGTLANRQKGGRLQKGTPGGAWARAKQGAADAAYDAALGRRERQQYAGQIRKDRSVTNKGISSLAKDPPKVASGSKFGKGVAMGSGVQGTLGGISQLARQGSNIAAGSLGAAGRDFASKQTRKFKIGKAKAVKGLRDRQIARHNRRNPNQQVQYNDPGLGMRKPGRKIYKDVAKKPLTLGQKARRDAALKRKLQQQREEFSCWREDFVWEADKKYPSGEKEKIIDVMKGKNTIEINPEIETDKYRR